MVDNFNYGMAIRSALQDLEAPTGRLGECWWDETTMSQPQQLLKRRARFVAVCLYQHLDDFVEFPDLPPFSGPA